MSNEDMWEWLELLAKSWGAEEQLSAQKAVLAWRGTGFSAMARALYVERGVLYLAVASHVEASELNLLKPRLLDRLAEVSPGCGVTDLRFQVRAGPPKQEIIPIPPPSRDTLRHARRELPPDLPPRLRGVLAEALAWARTRDEAVLRHGGRICPRCGWVLRRGERGCPSCRFDRSTPEG